MEKLQKNEVRYILEALELKRSQDIERLNNLKNKSLDAFPSLIEKHAKIVMFLHSLNAN